MNERERRTSDTSRTRAISEFISGRRAELTRFAYRFDGEHIAVRFAGGQCAEPVTAELNRFAIAAGLDFLWISDEDEVIQSWFGAREGLAAADVHSDIRGVAWPEDLPIAIGELTAGLDGFRLTYRQSRAALAVARRQPGTIARYSDVALLAAALEDDLLARSLLHLYIRPIEGAGKRADTFKLTLRAYFASRRNVSASAAALGLSRHTVSSRLRSIEGLLGRPLERIGPELEVALRLVDLN
jgi:PucR C-terminal helix-turn-helix domain/GGDEF-like domain